MYDRSAEVLVTLEHEVRSMRHPMYARALVNRNPATTNNHYATGHEAAAWRMPPRLTRDPVVKLPADTQAATLVHQPCEP